jgi:aquaporin Z
VALFAGPAAISQLWLFWLAPVLGGLIGGMLYGWLGRDND